MKKVFLFASVLLTSCASKGPWSLDTIFSHGNVSYHLVRLLYRGDEQLNPIQLELTKSGQNSELLITLVEFAISPAQSTPQSVLVKYFIEGGKALEEMTPLYSGGMRLRPSDEMKKTIIKALQDGFKIDIVIDDVTGQIPSENFAKLMKQGGF